MFESSALGRVDERDEYGDPTDQETLCQETV